MALTLAERWVKQRFDSVTLVYDENNQLIERREKTRGNAGLLVYRDLALTESGAVVGAYFEYNSGGALNAIELTYGLHVLTAQQQDEFQIDTPGEEHNGVILDIVTAEAYAHTLLANFEGGFTTATFDGAASSALRVAVFNSKFYVVSVKGVTLS